MIFSNLFFMLLFLPVFLLVYFNCKGTRGRNTCLLIFSLIFYCFGGVKYLFLLLVLTLIGYVCGEMIDEQKSRGGSGKGPLAAAAVCFVGVLFLFKYTGFFLNKFGPLFSLDTETVNIVMPIGISFYTFKLISYVADIYHERISPAKNFGILLMYTALFQNCVAGPIVRFSTIEDEIYSRRLTYTDMAAGAYRLCIGLAKKTILANQCGALAESFLPLSGSLSTVPVTGVWLGSIMYSLEIFLDFAAYSDMALGLGRMTGFHFDENFNYPYISASIKEFWRRWHISLSSFFRDYVYIPLGGNRKGAGRTVFNLFVVWALTGLWHGSTLNFLVWGLFYFVLLNIENALTAHGKRPLPKALGTFLTLFFVNIGWIIFRFEDFGSLLTVLKGLFGLNHNAFGGQTVTITLLNSLFIILVSLIACTPAAKKLGEIITASYRSKHQNPVPLYVFRIVIAVILCILSLFAIIGGSYSPFLYAQF